MLRSSEATCRGSIVLGSACSKCSKCKAERASIVKAIDHAAKGLGISSEEDRLRRHLQHSVDRLRDLLLMDDGQAAKEAEKFIALVKKEGYVL